MANVTPLVQIMDEILEGIDQETPTIGDMMETMTLEEMLERSLNRTLPWVHAPVTDVDMWSLRKYGRTDGLPLEVVNTLFKFAQANPTHRQMEAILDVKEKFDAVIAASEGTLFWAEDENMCRISPTEFLAREGECPQKLKQALGHFFCNDLPGRPENRWVHRYNWITEEGPCGSIKPAKR